MKYVFILYNRCTSADDDWSMRSSGLSQSSTASTSSGVVVGSPLTTTRSKRKRRASSPSLTQCSDGPPLRQKFAHTPAGFGAAGPIYDAIKYNSTFLANILERLPCFHVRQMARVATDWTSIAYSELRRRAGNRPFNLLWNVSLRSHFHKAWLVGNGRDIRPVKTILSFGNLAIESELVKDDDGTLSNCHTHTTLP
jgi:hypothetical protein